MLDDLGADSLDTVEIIMKFEEQFGIEIPDEDAKSIKTGKSPPRPDLAMHGICTRRREQKIMLTLEATSE